MRYEIDFHDFYEYVFKDELSLVLLVQFFLLDDCLRTQEIEYIHSIFINNKIYHHVSEKIKQ